MGADDDKTWSLTRSIWTSCYFLTIAADDDDDEFLVDGDG
jgi:hypothetical protein